MAGEVRVGPAGGGRRSRASWSTEGRLSVVAAARFVSRGGLKLDNALSACGLEVAARRALDVGASTGGFIDCLLQRGAGEVIAVDVGYGTLDYGLRTDPRVHVLERTNARVAARERASLRARPGRRSTCRSSR